MTFNAVIANYATEAYLSYYQADGLDYYRDESEAAGFPDVVTALEADLRDLYKNANLDDAFPSLTLLTEDASETEASYIVDHAADIAQRLYGLLMYKLC